MDPTTLQIVKRALIDGSMTLADAKRDLLGEGAKAADANEQVFSALKITPKQAATILARDKG